MNARQVPPPKLRVPFVVGITGNMDPAGYSDEGPEPESIQALRATVRGILDWIRSDPDEGWLDPTTGRFERGAPPVTGESPCWRALGLRHTPLVFLSALAPGIDTLVAEDVLDYPVANGDAKPRVRGVLPFPLEQYRRSTSFRARGAEAPGDAKVGRFERLLARMGAQDEWDEERDLFVPELHPDLAGDPESDLTAVDPVSGRPRRHLRYRAAGEVIASCCDMLLAVHDHQADGAGNPDDIFEPGAATVVAVKRCGLAWHLLAETNSFTWADNGPVLRVEVRRQSSGADDVGARGSEGAGVTRFPLTFLHPPDLSAEAAERHARGDEIFRKIAGWLEGFNCEEDAGGVDEEKELDGLLRPGKREEPAPDPVRGPWERFRLWVLRMWERFWLWVVKMLGSWFPSLQRSEQVESNVCPPDPDCRAHAYPLRRIAAIRRRASQVSGDLDKKRDRLLVAMLWFVGVAVFFITLQEHWHPQAGHGCCLEPILRALFLVIALGFVLAGGVGYYCHLRDLRESRRFDARALGEGLRVQFYWSMAGLPDSVAANYMQRQRGEMDWIRCAVGALSYPCSAWKRRFDGLTAEVQHRVLRVVRDAWIGGQYGFFKKNAGACERAQLKWHRIGWACGAAAIVQIAMMALQGIAGVCGAGDGCWAPWVDLAIAALFAVGGWMLLDHGARQRRDGGYRPSTPCDARVAKPFLKWLFGQERVWGYGLLIAAALFLLPIGFAWACPCLPGRGDWWTIVTGTSILVGALLLLLSERRFYGELHRQYATMESLFGCADRRLDALLDRLKGMTDKGDPRRALLMEEIQDLLRKLGCEALDENAEWLILRRARPLEPVMP